jgi:hypothetical protein
MDGSIMRQKESSDHCKGQKIIESDVLFQKLGCVWYAFSEIDDQIIYSALPKGICPKTSNLDLVNIVEKHLKKVSKAYKKTNEVLV